MLTMYDPLTSLYRPLGTAVLGLSLLAIIFWVFMTPGLILAILMIAALAASQVLMMLYDWIMEDTPASQLQSLAQLGAAVSLAYVVAAPTLRANLAWKLGRFERTIRNIDLLREGRSEMPRENVVSVPASDEGDENLRLRGALLNWTRTYIDGKISEVAEVGPAKTLYYGIAATAFFGVLVWTSLAAEISNVAVSPLIAAVFAVTIIDPLMIWWKTRPFDQLADVVLYEAKTIHGIDPTAVENERLKQLLAELLLLNAGSRTIEQALEFVRRNHGSQWKAVRSSQQSYMD